MIKKIIIFIPNVESGGIEKNAFWLANKLREEGYSIDFYFSSDKDNRTKKLEGITLKKTYESSNRIIAAFNTGMEILKNHRNYKRKETVIISFQSNIISIIVAKILKLKIIVRISNHSKGIKQRGNFKRRNIEKLKKFFYKYADVIIGVSKQIAEDFSKEIKREVLNIYNPVSVDKNQTKIVKFLPTSIIKIVSVGRLVPEKDHLTLLKAISLLKEKDKVKVLIIGEGSERNNIENYIKKYNLKNIVSLIGFKKNVNEYLTKADLFVLSSSYEGLPNALLEAYVLGKPIISTDCFSGPKEILMNGKFGDLVPVGDEKVLAEKIEEFIENPRNLKEKARLGKNYLFRFSEKRILKKYLKVLNSLEE